VSAAKCRRLVLTALASVALLNACAGRSGVQPVPISAGEAAKGAVRHPGDVTPTPSPSPSPTPTPTATPTATPTPFPVGRIKHVVVVIQENRSFDNLFQGYPGANTSPTGLNSSGQVVTLQPIPFEAPYDVKHRFEEFGASYDQARMDGFDKEPTQFYPSTPPPGYTLPPNPQYGYVPQAEAQPYFNLAQQYVLADNMFASQLDGSFTAHQYLIAGQAGGTVDLPQSMPWGCDNPTALVQTLTQQRTFGPQVPPCFSYPTLASELDTARFSWRYYAPPVGNLGYIWSAFDAVSGVRNSREWSTHVLSPETQFFSDLQRGYLANVAWISPDWANSDHSGSGSSSGPLWVTSIVNAIGQSKFWNSTAIVVVWDDWGGWYDHVAPQQLDYDGLGFRVPMLVVSAYAKQNYVTHVNYESASIVKFIEQHFGLPALSASDSRAVGLADCFNLGPSATPRPFLPFALPRALPHRQPSYRAPDEE
jgi:phospholipase C